MSRRAAFLLIASLCAGLGLAGPAAAGEEKPAAGQEGAMAPEMELMMKLAQPGEHHKHLDSLVGSWTYTGRMYEAPGQPPMDMNGTVEANWILGGRFVESVYKGDYMGMPFEGRALDGYDNQAQKYTGTWMDNFGTMMMVFSGSCSNEGKVRTMTADYTDPMTSKTMKFKAVTTQIDHDHLKYEAFTSDGGGNETKVVEMSMTRR